MIRQFLQRVAENIREHGAREAAERSTVWLANRAFGAAIHRNSRPSLAAFSDLTSQMYFAGTDFSKAFSANNPEEAKANVVAEYAMLSAEIERRYRSRKQLYPATYALEEGSARLLYQLVRFLRPEIVVETGVANGHSSFFILNALMANNSGILHSIDREQNVGSLLRAGDRERWCLHTLERQRLKKSFVQILESLPSIGLFLHDSDHTYAWQRFELEAALKRLAPSGVLVSDDCDASYAFVDFCRDHNFSPSLLVEKRKVFGCIFEGARTGQG